MNDFCLMMRIYIPGEAGVNDDVVAKAVPAGFSVIPAAPEKPWPKDTHGFTYVPLKCKNEVQALDHWINRARGLERELESLRPKVE